MDFGAEFYVLLGFLVFVCLLAYLGVHLVAWRLAPEIGANRFVVGLGIVSMLAVLVVFVWDLWQTQPSALWMAAAVVIGAIVVQMALGSGRRADAV